VLLELRVAEQRFNAVMEVIRDGLTVIEVAERYGLRRDRTRHRSPLTIEDHAGQRPRRQRVPERSGGLSHRQCCTIPSAR
jgi:transposase-like protein